MCDMYMGKKLFALLNKINAKKNVINYINCEHEHVHHDMERFFYTKLIDWIRRMEKHIRPVSRLITTISFMMNYYK